MLNLNRISGGIEKLKKQTKGANRLLMDKVGNGMQGFLNRQARSSMQFELDNSLLDPN